MSSLAFFLIASSVLGPLVLICTVIAIVYRLKRRNRPVVQLNPGRRGMFCFNDGLHDREVDPIDVYLSLKRHPTFDLAHHPLQVQIGVASAYEPMLDAIKQAFGVVDYKAPDQPGLTKREMLELFDAFSGYTRLQKKSTQPSPTNAQSTAATSRESSEPTTKLTSGSGSIDLEPATK